MMEDSMAQMLTSSRSIDLSNIQYEILVHILKFVDHKTQVFSCRLVNSDWKLAVESESLRNRAILTGKIRNRSKRYPWYYYYFFLDDKLYKNLIKNPCGKAGLREWIQNGSSFNSFWSIEIPQDKVPHQLHQPLQNDFYIAMNPLPIEAVGEDDNGELHLELPSCFVSAGHGCKIYQDIDLVQHFSRLFLDENQFNIIVSVWCTSRFGCGSTYELTVNQIDEYDHVLTEEVSNATFQQWSVPQWEKIELNIVPKPGVRFVRVTHTGKDTQFWAGNYGSKITLSRLIVTLKE